jgi:acyl-CoA synthetase (AMP-forming)/AMP-acid ligase II
MRAATGTPLLPGLKIVCTAAALSPAERQRVMRTLSPQLYVNYGTSEVGNLAMALPEELALGPNIVGQVEPEIEAEAVDDADRPLPPGAVGVLRFRHPRFAMAYLDTGPVATSRFVDGWFYPGDVGVIDADRRVHLHGRVDGMINVGGRMVYPADIENCLHNHPAVRDAVVLGWPSARLGVVPVAIAVVSGDTSEAELRHLCRAHFGELLTPRRIAFVDAIPRTDGGKVDRRALAALARRALDEVDQS